jgi:hypothetical protein
MSTATLAKKQLILGLESTAGTALTLANADHNIKFYNIEVDMDIEEYVLQFASGRHSYGPSTMGKRSVTFKARAAMLLGGAAATAPNLGKAFKSCGLLETVVSSTSVAYTPNATKDEGDSINATIAVQFLFTSGNAVQVLGKGCIGEVSVTLENGALVADFEWVGALVSVTDATALVLTSPDTGAAPQLVAGATITVGAVAKDIDNLMLKAGTTRELQVANSDATGYLKAVIRKREPELSINPRMMRLTNDTNYTRWAAGTQSAFSAATPTVSGLKWTISAPKASLKGDKPGARGQEVTWEETYSLRESSGDDEFKIMQSA